MRKTLCAFALTLALSGVVLAGEMPQPPAPPPPGGGFVSQMPDDQTLSLQTADVTVTDYILDLMQDVLEIF
jgi:hypothetical protein